MAALRTFWVSALGGLLLAASGLGHAHLMPAQQGTINIVGPAAYVVLAVPVSAMVGVDDNRDSRLSEAELQTHRDPLVAQVIARFGILEGDVRTPAQVLQLIAEPDERPVAAGAAPAPALAPQGGAGARYFLVLMRHSLSTEGAALAVETDLFGQLADEKQLTLKLSRGTDTEAAVLTPLRPSHQFFQPASEVFLHYVGIGVEHIVLGWDHLLFLLTLMVGARGWRYWFALLTSFTLAHSVTLAASLLGWVQASPAWVEPGIAASIVLMAGLNLFRAEMAMRRRMAIVAACGLLHGLGFAGAMAAMGLHGIHKTTSLLGFNVGIELGQALCVVLALGLAHLTGWLMGRVPALGLDAHGRHRAGATVASWCAMGLGGFWLLERLGLFVGNA
ncbi:MAG: hypothetical protein CFE43_10390 [Burkholderiales bacterium PBB3]|nr:MAG: hypothetical protein CFE43_10390 [Burkholderiales bacterium PBB3]